MNRHGTAPHRSQLRLRAESAPSSEVLGFLEEAAESKRRVRHRVVRELARLEDGSADVLAMRAPAASPRADAAANPLGELLLAEQAATLADTSR